MFGLFGFIIASAVFIAGIIIFLTSPFDYYKTKATYLLFVLFGFLVIAVGISIHNGQPQAIEMCKMRCPYYNAWSTPEKYNKYSECADVCENGQSFFGIKKRMKGLDK